MTAAKAIPKQLLAQYETYLRGQRNLSPKTVFNYLTDIQALGDFLSDRGKQPQDLDRLLLRAYVTWLSGLGYVKPSIVRKLSVLRSFYQFLEREGLLDGDQGARTSSIKLERRLPSFLDHNEAKQLVEAPDLSNHYGVRDKAILELLYASGLRLSEIAKLELSALNLAAREVRVRGKGNKERVVPVGSHALEALENYLRDARPKLVGRRPVAAVFLNRYGGRLSARSIQEMVRQYAMKAGVQGQVHTHTLRHTFATHLLDGGADLRVVQELLGHSSPTTTQIYTHVTQSQARKVYLAAHPRAKPTEER